MKIAYFDCFSGISGDMTLAALISAGWPREALERLPARLGLASARITIEPVKRGVFTATRVDVQVSDPQPHRHLRHVVAMIEAADLPSEVRARAIEVFRRLAAAEAEVHGTTIERVHFHEVGAVDALIDVVGAVLGLAELAVERVFASPPRLGTGSVRAQHGVIPVPAPATALLLRGAPVEITDIKAELVTPTGAALLAVLVEAWIPPPTFTIERIGTGAGARDLAEQANVLRVLIGEAQATRPATRRVSVLETALDDENPQFVGALIPRLIEAGAFDAMVVPTVMKKGRPGLWLIVIAPPEKAEPLARLLLRETTTLGVRVREEQRYELERRSAEVETRFGRVAVKVAMLEEGGGRVVPEFESVRAAAERAGRPLREVAEAAIAAFGQAKS